MSTLDESPKSKEAGIVERAPEIMSRYTPTRLAFLIGCFCFGVGALFLSPWLDTPFERGVGMATSDPRTLHEGIVAGIFVLSGWTKASLWLPSLLAFSMTGALLFLLLLRLGHERRTALAGAAALVLGSPALVYAGRGFPEPLLMLFLLAAILAIERDFTLREWGQAGGGRLWLAGFLGLGLVLQSVVWFGVVGLLAVWVACDTRIGRSRLDRGRDLARFVGPVLIGFLAGIFMGLGGVGMSLSPTGAIVALPALLFSFGKGLLWFFPLLCLSAAGGRRFYDRRPTLALFCGGMIFLLLLQTACRTDWMGGHSLGPRHLVPLLPLLLLPAVEMRRTRAERWAFVLFLAVGLFGAVLGAATDFHLDQRAGGYRTSEGSLDLTYLPLPRAAKHLVEAGRLVWAGYGPRMLDIVWVHVPEASPGLLLVIALILGAALRLGTLPRKA